MKCFAAACLVVLAGCGVSLPHSSLPPASGALGARTVGAFKNLYVDLAGSVDVFAPGNTTPIRTITNGINYSVDMAVDSKGYLYVSNEDSNSVSVYAPKSGSVLRSLVKGIEQPGSVLTDKKGYVYVASCFACNSNSGTYSITVYSPGGTHFKRMITKGLGQPWRMAFDPSGTLYVINGTPRNDVTIYPPGASAPKGTISAFTGVGSPDSLAFDGAGDLFLGVSGHKAAIRIYPPHTTTPNAFIRRNIHYPAAMAVDASGRLYVLNSNVNSGGKNEILVLSTASHKLLRTITKGLAEPFCLLIDSTGQLYVGNWGNGSDSPSITVYSPGGASLIETIPLLQEPHALAFGP